jgi:hypothetical protein
MCVGSLLRVGWYHHRAPLDRAAVDVCEYLIDVVERVRFDKRFDLYLAVEHEV